MDYLESRHLLAPKVVSIRNRLADRAADRSVSLQIGPGFSFTAALGTERRALANRIASRRQVRQGGIAGIGRVDVRGEQDRANRKRAALTLVARGEAPFGVVYATDAAAEPKVRVVGTFAESTSTDRYPIAVVAGQRPPAATTLVAYLASAAARPTWVRYGFTMAGQGSP